MCNDKNQVSPVSQYDCAAHGRYRAARYSSVLSPAGGLAAAMEAVQRVEALSEWDPDAFTSIQWSCREVSVQVRGEDFGAEIAEALFDAAPCVEWSVRGNCQWRSWNGVRADVALHVVTSWPLVERDPSPEDIARGVAEGWAEAESDPARIDWAARQADAVIPFEVMGGRPVTPGPRTGVQRGRNEMGRWGESLAGDVAATATLPDHSRWVLMVERGDGLGWALPGGGVDPGETPEQAAIRELAEETGLVLPTGLWVCGEPQVVPDPRGSDEAWTVTTVVDADFGVIGELPAVHGNGAEIPRAEWVRADTYEVLTGDLRDRLGGSVFAAHVGILTKLADDTAW